MPIGKRVGLINKYLLLVIGLLHPLMLCGVKGVCKIVFSSNVRCFFANIRHCLFQKKRWARKSTPSGLSTIGTARHQHLGVPVGELAGRTGFSGGSLSWSHI